MPRNKPKTTDEEIRAVKLEIERARLAKLEAELPPPPTPQYTRYEDLPPLMPEDRERLKAELIEQLEKAGRRNQRKKYEWYMSMAHLAP